MTTSTDENVRWKELGSQIQVFLQWSISSIIDSAFLAFWVFLQWFIDVKVIQTYRLSKIDNWVLLAFQILFAVSTVIPVIIFIYTDIRVMFLRAKRRIQKEIVADQEGKPIK